MSSRRRRQRRQEMADSTESGSEMLRKKINKLHYSNARIWGEWQSQVTFIGWFVIIYAVYHAINDLREHFNNNQHLALFENVLDCLWQILVHIVTGINAYLIRQYIKTYPLPQAKKWLFYILPISTFECMFIMHAFPMGTFYLMVCLSMVYFIDYQGDVFKQGVQKLNDKLN